MRNTVNMSDEENITDKDLIVAIQIALKSEYYIIRKLLYGLINFIILKELLIREMAAMEGNRGSLHCKNWRVCKATTPIYMKKK